MLKRFLVVGVALGGGLLMVGAGALLGVGLGTRALVVSAAAVKPAASISMVPIGSATRAPVIVAMGQ